MKKVALVNVGYSEDYVGRIGTSKTDKKIVYVYTCSYHNSRCIDRYHSIYKELVNTNIITIYLDADGDEGRDYFTCTEVIYDKDEDNTCLTTGSNISNWQLEAIRKTIKQLHKKEFGDE